MNGFLERMACVSQARMDKARACESLLTLRNRARDRQPPPALQIDQSFGLIAELKLRSPAIGRLCNGSLSLESRAIAYAQAGAMAVSVLTEPSEFDGDLAHLELAATALKPFGVPVMRKDFLVDPYQLYEARAAGAGGVLLIVRLLSRDQLTEMVECARELGLFVLLEAFDRSDITRVVTEVLPSCDEDHKPPLLIGVNCRDLRTLEVQPQRLRDLAPLLPQGITHVVESGIATPEECQNAARMGYEVALVGSALMTVADPAVLIRAMITAGRKAAWACW
jgi:indole-3-glycerol phosphate synthase